MQEQPETWRLYIPTISFKGLQNQFHHWLGSLMALDFGKSYLDKRDVLEKIKESLPWTIFMGFFSFVISYMVAIPVGVWSVQKRNQWQDRSMTVGLFLMHSVPSFVTSMLLMTLLCNPEYLHIFPTTGIASDNAENWPFFDRLMDHIWHLTLPTLVYSYGAIAFVSRQMRVGMLENISMDYIRTARAKGLSENAVVWKHALRNSLLPVLTNFSGFFPHLIAGSVIIETIFSIPGMGRLTIQALSSFDHPVLLAIFTLSSIFTLLGILITDLLYVMVDPRISFTKSK
jgi:peptide/nickel transport system permease protein